MKVFVTGASGTIGRSVVPALRKGGHEVIALTSKEGHRSALEQQGARVVVGDMRDGSSWKAEVAAADAVVHLAQAGAARMSKSAAQSMADADEKAVDTLLASVSGRCKSLIYTSGVWIYGDSATPADESAARHPFPMIAYKSAGEDKILAAAKSGAAPGMVLRPGLVYAPWGIFDTMFLKPMKKGGSAKFPGKGDNVVSYVHVDDCAAAFVAAVERPLPGEVFNVCDDEPVSVKAMLSEMARQMGAKAPGGIPGFVIKLAAGGMLAAPLLANASMSAKKARAQLGFTPKYPTYREGTAAIAASARAPASP